VHTINKFVYLSRASQEKHKGKVRDRYRIVKMLGSRAFGEIFVQFHRDYRTMHAINVLNKNHMD